MGDELQIRIRLQQAHQTHGWHQPSVQGCLCLCVSYHSATPFLLLMGHHVTII
ncbi:hypothetical protein OESDEN_22329 [Oesophagostomum dentatum]|uniref:Uncharacterized protein n=1 Tax=Oesophagostomum dentatum TaxID=61180 RepID=A0A0B1S2E4_OESDE|nr:hypothetical protein OESDEN_22329 [Oesophagostomum dentatum]